MNESKLNKLEKETVYNEKKKRMAKSYSYLNTLATKQQAVFVGDSIIEMWPDEMLWPLSSKLMRRIYNRGIGGDTSNRLLERIETNVCALEPSICYLLIGTNDIEAKFPPELTVQNIRSIIETIQLHCPQCKIYIQGLLPVNRSIDRIVGARKNKKIAALNEMIRAIAADTGCKFVDLTEYVTDDNGDLAANYTFDGLHPTVNCYHRLSEVLVEKIDEEYFS